jgi:hypothetical protein
LHDWNDRISSVKVPPGKTLVLYEHASFGGASVAIDGDRPDLRQIAGPGGTWNDQVSSFRIY